jgi:hypothetical protein
MKITNAKEMVEQIEAEKEISLKFVTYLLENNKIKYVENAEEIDDFQFNLNLVWWEQFINHQIKPFIHK